MTSVSLNLVTALKKALLLKAKTTARWHFLETSVDLLKEHHKVQSEWILQRVFFWFFLCKTFPKSEEVIYVFMMWTQCGFLCQEGKKAFWLVHHGIALQNQSARTTYTGLKWCWYGAILQMIVICKLQMNFQILQSSGAGSSGVFRLPIKQQLTTFFYTKARNMRLQIHSKHVLPCNGCEK